MIRNFFLNGYKFLFLLLLFIFHLLTVDPLSVNKIDKFIRFFFRESSLSNKKFCTMISFQVHLETKFLLNCHNASKYQFKNIFITYIIENLPSSSLGDYITKQSNSKTRSKINISVNFTFKIRFFRKKLWNLICDLHSPKSLSYWPFRFADESASPV